nr:MAG TPA: hypothetical protein [Caudoviricetes sp.]
MRGGQVIVAESRVPAAVIVYRKYAPCETGAAVLPTTPVRHCHPKGG